MCFMLCTKSTQFYFPNYNVFSLKICKYYNNGWCFDSSICFFKKAKPLLATRDVTRLTNWWTGFSLFASLKTQYQLTVSTSMQPHSWIEPYTIRKVKFYRWVFLNKIPIFSTKVGFWRSFLVEPHPKKQSWKLHPPGCFEADMVF